MCSSFYDEVTGRIRRYMGSLLRKDRLDSEPQRAETQKEQK